MRTTARDVLSSLLEQQAAGAGPRVLAENFSEDVDWWIPGDLETVPWIGRKRGRAGVAEFFDQLTTLAAPLEFVVEEVLGDADRCVALGRLRTRVLSTGRIIESEFAIDVTVGEGLITRYHLLEDSWAVAHAFS